MKAWVFGSLWLLMSGAAHAGDVLKACGNPDYPPFTYVRDAKPDQDIEPGTRLEGVAPDVLNAIFGDLGITVQAVVSGSWARCQKLVEHGDADIMMAAYRNEERVGYALFTETPIADDPQSIFVWKGREFPFEKWDDLLGRRGGIPIGFSAGDEFDAFLSEHHLVETVRERLGNFRKLEAGRIDFDYNGLYAGLILVKRLGFEGRIVPLKTPINVGYPFLPISRKSRFADRLGALDAGLKRLTADGTIATLIARHLRQFGVGS